MKYAYDGAMVLSTSPSLAQGLRLFIIPGLDRPSVIVTLFTRVDIDPNTIIVPTSREIECPSRLFNKMDAEGI